MNDPATSRLLCAETVPPETWVYFLYSAGKIKIGTAEDFYKRLGAIKGACSSEVYCVLLFPGGRVTERHYHKRFAQDRLHGEWFALSPELRSFIEENDDYTEAEWCLAEAEAA